MTTNYSFLTDELALIEIRKHKWIESEKVRTEIGFATAACDWVKKYGETWKKIRLHGQTRQSIFSEKRQYRRFTYNSPIQIKTLECILTSYTNDINLLGLSCTTPVPLSEQTPVEITLHLPQAPNHKRTTPFRWKSRIIRNTPLKSPEKSGYQIVLSLSEEIRDYLSCNPGILSLARG